MKFAVLTFGCRVNQADSLAFEAGLRDRGAQPAPPDEADLIIVNSCSVTAAADQGTRQSIRRAARTNPRARIVVTGCYATRRPDEVASLPAVIRVIPNADKDRLPAIVEAECGIASLDTRARFSPEGDGPCGLHLVPGAGGRTAFLLRVQTGCSERCSYCIIPSTRGASASRRIEWVLEQLERAAAAGYREMTVTGVHLGAYGRDLHPPTSLATLLERIAGAPLDVLVRIGSLEPMDCTPAVLDVIAGSARLAPAFHLPLQHASPGVLARMRRPYTVEYYASLVDAVRRRLPAAAIGSDIIVGFPGETDEDFEQLEQYLSGSPLTHLHVFPYSDRPGTEASHMPGAVPGSVVRERARRIREAGARLARAFRASQAGTTQRALVIDDGWKAVTASGLRLTLSEQARRNDWVDVRVRLEGEALWGDAVYAGSSVAAR